MVMDDGYLRLQWLLAAVIAKLGLQWWRTTNREAAILFRRRAWAGAWYTLAHYGHWQAFGELLRCMLNTVADSCHVDCAYHRSACR